MKKTLKFDPSPLENKMVRVQIIDYRDGNLESVCNDDIIMYCGKYIGLDYAGSLLYEEKKGYRTPVFPQDVAKKLIKKGMCVKSNKHSGTDGYTLRIWSCFNPNEMHQEQ